MQQQDNISTPSQRYTLSDFVPLIFAFFACLILLSVYQHLRLYIDGVLDGFLNKSLGLLILHNLGFAAIVGLILAFVFNLLEAKKPGLGIKVVKIALFVLLLVEGLLIEYYVRQYEALENNIFNLAVGIGDLFPILSVISIGIVIYFAFAFVYKRMATVYQVVSKMYPFTIVLFSLFLGILNSDKKPINENKTQHFLVSVYENLTDFNTYDGTLEFPLLQAYEKHDVLGQHFNLQAAKPNIVLLVIDGLGADFLGKNAPYHGFTPYLQNLAQQSLYWENFLSNTTESSPALTSITGSLPFGKTGFTNANNFVNRQSLFSILKKNGYQTSFYYGGNSALNHLDKFLDEEQVDYVLDKKGFGTEYTLQEVDGAGITLGYPDKELFKKWNMQIGKTDMPVFEVFKTTSTKRPYNIPNAALYEKKVQTQLRKAKLTDRQKRLVKKNVEIFGSMIYMDDAIASFMRFYQKKPTYKNTIFIITGSHNLSDLPKFNELARYKVPLLMYSPMLKAPKTITSLASHVDILPSMVNLLDEKYAIEVPKQHAWLGNQIISDAVFQENKSVPLFRVNDRIKEYIVGDHLIVKNTGYQLTTDLKLKEIENGSKEEALKKAMQRFRAVNTYVVEKNKLIPKENSLVVKTTPEFSKADLIWVESVFNGNDFDNAYGTAKKLAFNHEWDRSLLLCNYILTKIPGHADTEILMGRINAWKTDYSKAAELLQKVIQKYPVYADGYAALFDVYFWAKEPKKAIELAKLVERNKINNPEVKQKIDRAHVQLNALAQEQNVQLSAAIK